MSPANNLDVEKLGRKFSMSLINTMNKIEPTKLPWATPLITGRVQDSMCPTLTLWVLSLTRESMHLRRQPRISIACK